MIEIGDIQDHHAMAALVDYLYHRLAGADITHVGRVGPDNHDPPGTPDELLVTFFGRHYIVAVFPRKGSGGEQGIDYTP